MNSSLGPEMKSTGEVLGVGRTREEALFKGLVSAGFKLGRNRKPGKKQGSVLMSVRDQDKDEVVQLAKKLDDLELKIYATKGTAKEVARLGIDVTPVNKLYEDNSMMDLLESGALEYIIFTGGGERSSIADYTKLHRRALQLSVACITSLDTANALADIIASNFSEDNTELVDINSMRKERDELKFAKVQSSGNDYLIFENFDGKITYPEALPIHFTDRRSGIGADGVILVEHSNVADAKMRFFNRDGSESNTAANGVHGLAKYLYDKGIVKKEMMTVETGSGVKTIWLHSFNGQVTSCTIDIGGVTFDPKKIPVLLEGESAINRAVTLAGDTYHITCMSLGNPHCVIFADKLEEIDVRRIGSAIEYDAMFPERVNVEFVRMINDRTLKMRVWERGSGETWTCGSGACAAAIAAVENGFAEKRTDITIKVRGGDMTVNYTEEHVLLTGETKLIYEGTVLY